MPKITVTYNRAEDNYVATDAQENILVFKAGGGEAQTVAAKGSVGPMLSLLMAMGACSGIDIVMILEKQRQSFDTLVIEVKGEREKEVTPALWIKAHVHYILSGNVEPGKAEKAAQLSVDKYCSVAETLRRAGCAISYSVSVH